MSSRHDKESGVSTARSSPAGRSTMTWPFGGAAGQLRSLARRVHFLAGILVAPFLLVLCLTGLVYVFSPQIHDDLYGGQLFVQQVGGMPRPVAEQVAAALAAHPEAALRSVVPPPEPDRTTRVNLSVPSLDEPGEARTVFVDPYTNYINGELTTVDGRMPANVWLRDLHANFHLGEVGRLYSEIAASWLPVLVVGGLVLWIGKQGRRRRSARELLVPVPRGKGEQARLRSVHGPLGIWLTVGLLVMSVTGLTMSRFAGWGLPSAQPPTLALDPVQVGANQIGVDQVLQVARAAGLGGELEVAAPAEPDRPFTVAEKAQGLPIQKDSIAVDPYTAEITERIGWGDYPFLAQMRELGVQFHTGTLFGLANQILLALLVIATIVLILGGYRMWWKRGPYQGKLPAGPPPALSQLTGSVGVPVVLVTVVLAWLMPAFGISLAAFLVVDLVINAVRQRRERVRRTVTAGALLLAGSVLGIAVLANASSPVSQLEASGTYPGQRIPAGTAPDAGGTLPDEPPLDAQAAPDGASGAGAATRPVPGPGVRPGAPAGGAAGPGVGSNTGADGPGDRPAGGNRPVDGDTSADGGSGSGGNPDDADGSRAPEASRNFDSPGPSDGPSGPVDDVPEPQQPQPPAEDPADEPTGVIGGLVGALSDAAEPVTSYLGSTVDSVVGGLLGG
jgi:uncharacterized iron-regulated membrane protein